MKITCRISPVLKVRCIRLRWMSFRYCCTFVFVLDLFFAVMWYLSATSMYLSVSSNDPGMKSETSVVIRHVATKSKPNWSIANYHHTLHFCAIHLCHRWVYLMVIVIFAVVACTITFFIKTYLIFCFSLSFGGLGNFAIMWSSDPHLKHFQGRRS